MKANMGSVDRLGRLAAAAIVAFLYFTDRIDGVTAIVLGVIAAVFVLTSFVGVCPAYSVVGFSTRKKRI
jgi:hypothetical protein